MLGSPTFSILNKNSIHVFLYFSTFHCSESTFHCSESTSTTSAYTAKSLLLLKIFEVSLFTLTNSARSLLLLEFFKSLLLLDFFLKKTF